MERPEGAPPQGKRPVISKGRRTKVSTSEKRSQQEPSVAASGGAAVACGSSDTGRAQGAKMRGAQGALAHANIQSTAPRTHTTAARTHTIVSGRSARRPRDEGMTSGKKDEPPYELEEQFILRLPPEQAYTLRKIIHSRNVPMKDKLKIDFSSDGRHAVVQIEDVPLSAKLVDLPCAIGSMKTIDRKTFYQTADISQMLVCSASGGLSSIPEEPAASVDPLAARSDKKKTDKKYMWKHGITPPLKNVRKKRFQKVTEKFPETKQTDEISFGEYIDSPDVEKEVKRLLCSDAEAINVRWEVIGDEETKEIESQGCISGLPVTPQSDPISPEYTLLRGSISDSGSNNQDDDLEPKDDEDSQKKKTDVEDDEDQEENDDKDNVEDEDDDDEDEEDEEEDEEEEEQQERYNAEEELERELQVKFTEFSLCETYEGSSSVISGIQKLIDYKKKRLQEIRRKAQRQRDLLRDVENLTLISHFQSVLGQLNIKEKQLHEQICYLHAQLKYFLKEDSPRSGT